MIRSRLKMDTRVLDGLSNYAARFDQRAFETGERIFDSLIDDALDDLRTYPAPPPNSRYIRTGRLRNSWDAGISATAGSFTIEIINDATDKRGVEYSKYVQGSLAQSRSAAAKAQAWMHKGRWPLAVDTVNAFYELLLEEFMSEVQKDLSAYGTIASSRRAFTR